MLSAIDVTQGNYRLFNTIGVETSSACNRACSFCPQSISRRPDEYMPGELFNKIIRELGEMRFHGRIELYNYNEPLRDNRMKGFIKYVREVVPKACIMINTNGDYIAQPEGINELFDSGLNQMQINAYDSNAMARLTELCKGINFKPDCSIVYAYISPKKRALKLVDKSNTEKLKGVDRLVNRAGQIGSIGRPLEKLCARPFRHFIIGWNGEAVLCCNDYEYKVKIGNVSNKSILELWNSEVMHQHRHNLQRKNRNFSICSQCDYNGGVRPHMIHPVLI